MRQGIARGELDRRHRPERIGERGSQRQRNPDACDIVQGTSPDGNADGIPDECGACCGLTNDCNQAPETVCEAPPVYHGDGTNCNDVARAAVPTVSEWGMVGMALLLLAAGALVYARRRPAQA